MKPIRGQLRGVKQDPLPSKQEQIDEIKKAFENFQMAGRMQQMMVQQLMTNLQSMAKDLGKAFGTINELQYKIMAMQKTGSFNEVEMQRIADELRLNDFIEASDAEDVKGNFTIGAEVQADSTVVVTSSVKGDGAGIFRSRIKLADAGVPALTQGLLGKPVGTKVTCMLNDVEHEVELLAIRNPPPAVVLTAPAVEGITEVSAEDLPKSTDTVH